jgi:hypothetical protein
MTESFTGGQERIANLKDIFNNELDRIIATPQTPEFHIEGFVINGKLNETIEQKAEVTSNLVESGVIITDHIIVQPATITITGEVSDVEFLPKDPQQQAIDKRINKINDIIMPFIPPRTTFQINKIQSMVNKVDKYIDLATEEVKKGLQIYELVNPASGITRQQAFTAFFSMLLKAKTPITLTTKNKIWLNMALVGFSETSDQNSFLSFSFTFQELRFAQTETIAVEQAKNPSSQAKDQVQEKVDIGQQNEKVNDASILQQSYVRGNEQYYD